MSNSDDFGTGALAGVLLCCLIWGILLLFFIGPSVNQSGEDRIRKEAVSHGFAEWNVNTNTLEREFHWKD